MYVYVWVHAFVCKSRYNFGYVCGVAIDKDDNLYVSDAGSNCMYKFDKYGQLLQKFDEEFDYPRGVAVDDNQVFVCDCYNYKVKVLTTELKLVKSIGSKGAGDGQFDRLKCIAVDSDGMLYVSDGYNRRVQVFTRDGQFVRSFKKKGSQQAELKNLEGLFVDADYVYVSEYGEYDSSCVSVFTKDGQFVTSFHVSCAYGVSVDSDGFVYVCGSEGVCIF